MDYTIFIWMILTSNTEATENKVIATLFCVWENIRVHSNYGSLRVLAHSLSRISAGAEGECDRLTMVDTLVNGRSNGGNGLTVVPRATHCSRR